MAVPTFALVVDDERQVRDLVSNILRSEGWDVVEAASADEAISFTADHSFALVFCDVMLGSGDGYEVLKRYQADQPAARFVLMTGKGSAAGALDATAIGAFDYLVKPFSIDDIISISNVVKDQLKIRAKKKDGRTPEAEKGYVSDIPLIGKSTKFVECLKMVGRVAPTNLPVLITGDSGTGKEIVASAIHARSPRTGESFVTVNCGAIPVDLIESELFGHVKGSFTGASGDRTGLWEQADEGTIFLDEITETSPLFQVKLLRTLQQGEVRRVGSNKTLKVDVRVIAATNRDIEAEVADGRFRQDLMYRLNAVTIRLPSLRERVEDIPLLAEHFSKMIDRGGEPTVRFSSDAMKALQVYSWPGNVRELENAVLHSVSMADDIVYPEHLPERVNANSAGVLEPSALSDVITGTEDEFLTMAEMQRNYAIKVLEHADGNKQAAARILNIDRKTLARLVNSDG
jgi:two-component system, NtrC family, response regulator AtoC